MKIKIQTLNVQNAKDEYKNFGGRVIHKPDLVFSCYSPSYVLTNEDIRWVSELTKNEAKRVLTVAGSGDQPLFYAMNGAKNIDTFDISFCSKVVMDIKSAAIKKLTREEYINMIFGLYNSTSISNIPEVSKIISDIPRNTAYFIKEMAGYPICGNGLNPEYYKDIIPTAEEYEIMRHNISAPFKFIWSDIENLHTQLHNEYDVINLSNIFEYMTPKQMHNTLISLRNYVKPKGYIIAQTGSLGIATNNKAFYEASQKFKRWARMGHLKKDETNANSEEIAVLQRTR